ncbi:MAG TPA: peptidylprolyl isomerase [Candidatus Thermoplasmatota archaeon]
MKKGDIVRLEITASYAANGDVFETTDEAMAKEKDLWHEGHSYKPKVYIIGGESTDYPTGLELDLLKAKVGEKRELTLEAKDAFGSHNPLLVETISARELVRQGIEPEVGASVTRRNKTGHIAGVFGGRVRVDYNHPLAGKGLKYDYTVVQVAEDPHDKVAAVLDLHYGRGEEFRVHVKGKEADVTVPDVCKFDQAWATQKLRVVIDLREHAGIHTVRFIEEYVRKQVDDEGEAAPAAAEKPAAEKAAAEHKHAEGHAEHEGKPHAHEGAHAEVPKAEKPAKTAPKKAKAAEAK